MPDPALLQLRGVHRRYDMFLLRAGRPYAALIMPEAVVPRPPHSPPVHGTALRNRMAANFYCYANPATPLIPALVSRMYNKLASGYVDPTEFAADPRNIGLLKLPQEWTHVLHAIDFEKVTQRRDA
ncbi:MAG: hypothetical protein NZ473_06555 [Candidatus Kapabacteria bacterium]|nr:hypothetical protein [Candidatus Kapabacteria bacterium]MCS7169466.1 hypothetical protein [Candidatus Kapabacteria bacterium]MDW7996201.1 hypothetical protein [Bacteroidota bacterium]MDW8225930.1 hypothetical protein [Bacteroidota bacterium]